MKQLWSVFDWELSQLLLPCEFSLSHLTAKDGTIEDFGKGSVG